MTAAFANESLPKNSTLRLALGAISLCLMLALFLLFCIQAGRDGMQSTFRAWKITLFSAPYRESVRSVPVAEPTRAAPARPTAARVPREATRTSLPDSVPETASEPAKVAAALRASLRDYKPDASRTASVTLTTGGTVQTKTSGAPTTLDGVPVEQAPGNRQAGSGTR